MKKIRELVGEIRKSYPHDDFFRDFEESCRLNPLKRKHYLSYNNALEMLGDENWNIIKAKAVMHFCNERPGQRKQAFFNHLNEAFAYRYLFNKGFEDIRFIKEGRHKSPDLCFLDRYVEMYCEVKTIGISQEEIARRERNAVYDGGVYRDLKPGFLKKLAVAIGEAWLQIHSVGENGLVFVLLRFDDIALDHFETYRQQLLEFCRNRGCNNIVFKIGTTGNKTIRLARHLTVPA